MSADIGVDRKPGTNLTDRDRVSNFLFYLGKGLWKSVPILGPIIEEVLYAQFKDALTRRVSSLSADELNAIGHLIPQGDLEALDQRLNQLTQEVKLARLGIFEDIVFNVDRLSSRLEAVEDMVEPVPSILELVREIRESVENADDLRAVLARLEERRYRWIGRISVNQIKLLRAIPTTYTHVNEIWLAVQEIIPGCSYKEFRFRLHELEWLGLVARIRNEDCTWSYLLLSDGQRMAEGGP